jgi:hypothetical protein
MPVYRASTSIIKARRLARAGSLRKRDRLAMTAWGVGCASYFGVRGLAILEALER